MKIPIIKSLTNSPVKLVLFLCVVLGAIILMFPTQLSGCLSLGEEREYVGIVNETYFTQGSSPEKLITDVLVVERLVTEETNIEAIVTRKKLDPANPKQLAGLRKGSIIKTLVPSSLNGAALKAGTCAIVTDVNRQEQTVTARPIKYQHLTITDTLRFLYSEAPSITFEAEEIHIVGSSTLSNTARAYLPKILSFFAIALLILAFILYKVGRRNEKMRQTKYVRQNLRTLYRAKLLNNKKQVIAWEDKWKQIDLKEYDNYTPQTQQQIKEMIDGVLSALSFAGETAQERVHNITKDDIHCVKLFKKTYNDLIDNIASPKPLSEKVVKNQKHTVALILTALGVLRRNEGVWD